MKLRKRQPQNKERPANKKGARAASFSLELCMGPESALKRELWSTQRHYTRNDSPQPHSSFTFGLLNLKPSFNPSRAKSSSVPSMYARLFGSTTTFTPLLSNT